MKGERKVRRMIEAIFGEVQISYPFDGQALRLARESLGISQGNFAKLCGFPLKNLKQMEKFCKEKRCLLAEKRDTIVTVLYMLQTLRGMILPLSEENKAPKETHKCEGRTNSETWFLEGRSNPNLPGGGARHPLDMD